MGSIMLQERLTPKSNRGKTQYFGQVYQCGRDFRYFATAYNFRKFDFNKLFVGQKVPYRMLIDRQVADLFFRYLGKENVKTRNGKAYRLSQSFSIFTAR